MNTDSTWFAVLVIILSGFLAVVLILSIVLIIKVTQIMGTVKRITDQAEQVADRAEHITAFFEKTATPVALFKLVSNVTDVLQKKVKKK